MTVENMFPLQAKVFPPLLLKSCVALSQGKSMVFSHEAECYYSHLSFIVSTSPLNSSSARQGL